MSRCTTGMMAMLLAARLASAADGTLDEARRCAQTQDSLQRLVCYDRLFAPGASATADQEALFGAESLKRPAAEVEEDKPPRTLTGSVRDVRETRPNVYRITLDNGQIWQQMDMDSTFHIAAGDTVEIERGRMGGYRMSRTSKGGSGWVRVNRLK